MKDSKRTLYGWERLPFFRRDCTRRDVLFVSSRLILLPAFTGLGTRVGHALAADSTIDSFLAVVEKQKPAAIALEKQARSPNIITNSDLPAVISTRDFNQRMNLAKASEGVARAELIKAMQDKDLRDAYAKAADVRPAPPPAEIRRIPIQRQDVEKTGCPPDKGDVVIEVLLDSLDLLDEKEIYKEVLRKFKGFQEDVSEISKAMKNGKADVVIEGIFNLFTEYFVNKKFIQFALESIPIASRNRLLARLALRFVPYVGWIYVSVSLGLAVHRHWKRLTC